MKKEKIILLLCIFITNIIQSQDYYFKHYTVEDGLSHNTVFSSIQDKNGFMWFGTKNGLNRFDGYSFKLFQNNSNDAHSLHGNYIECLHEFNDVLWVGTDNGLYQYNEALENFDILKGTETKQIWGIINDDNGNLWFMTNNNLNKYNPKTKKSDYYPSNSIFYANALLKTPDNNIWVGSGTRLFKYEKDKNSFKSFDLNIETDEKTPFRINELFALDKHLILIGTLNHGVVVFDTNKNKIVEFLTELKGSIYVRQFVLKNKNELWVATESGIYIYDLKKHTLTNLTKNHTNPYALSDNAVYSLTVDNEGGIWAGTYFGGVNYYSNQLTPFKKYFPNPIENSISGNAVREIHPDKFGNLWIGTEDAGLNKYNMATGKFTHYASKERGGQLSHYNIHGVLPIDYKVWIGTFEHGLDILDIPTNKVVKRYNIGEKSTLRSNFIFSLYQTKANKIIACSTSAVQVYNPETDNYDLVGDFPENIHYTSFYEDNDGIYWAGSYSDGLFYYNPKTAKGGHYKHNSKIATSISNNHINGIFQGQNNTLWITTENGLNLYNKTNELFERFTTNNGFPSNAFYSILEENENKLWITTSNGLVAYEPKTGNKSIYTKENGLLSNQFNYNSAYKSPNGTMYFGSVSGMISFNPKDFVINTHIPPILITDIQINNQNVAVGTKNSPLEKSVTFLDKLVLKPTNSSFTLNFAALGFVSPESIEYWYKMKGLANEWVPINKNNKVNFTELAAGNYEFSIKSLSSNGVWSNASKVLEIEVLPVFWKSKPAFFLYTLFSFLLISIGVRYYHKRTVSNNYQRIRELSNKKEKEIYQAKIEFFTNVSHEIRTPLTLIKSPLDKLLKQTNHAPETQDNLSIMEKNTARLLDLVNQLLDFRKAEIESVSLTFVETNFTALINDTYERFSEAIKDKNINFKLNLGASDVFAFVDAEAVKKILSNLIGNAIKYSQRKIIINLEVQEDSLLLRIQNDGELIPNHLHKKIFEPFFRVSEDANHTGTGIGLALAYSLTKLHQGNLTLDMNSSKWNRFILKLPIQQERIFKLSPPKDLLEKDILETVINDSENQTNKPKILLAEDNIDLLNFVAKDLSDQYRVLKVTNGADALKMVESENIQLIVSDVMMPVMNGYELCKFIKSSIETSHIPVVLLTSKNALNSKIEGLESGADAYIEKPFSLPYLRVQITNLIENRKNILSYYASSPLAHLKSIALSDTDETFIDKLDDIISKNISNAELSVETLSDIMNMSRSTLYRKIKEMSNLSPNELINIARLKKAAELLKKGDYKIYEVSEMVGYNSQTSFGRNFQKQFNMTPTEYMNS